MRAFEHEDDGRQGPAQQKQSALEVYQLCAFEIAHENRAYRKRSQEKNRRIFRRDMPCQVIHRSYAPAIARGSKNLRAGGG
jgi:hypothetical protein